MTPRVNRLEQGQEFVDCHKPWLTLCDLQFLQGIGVERAGPPTHRSSLLVKKDAAHSRR